MGFLGFVEGGLAGVFATSIVQPIDVVKTRMQLATVGDGAKPQALRLFANIARTEGLRGIYSGLSAGIFRQVTYTSTRLGVYTWLLSSASKKTEPPPFLVKVGLGMMAGGLAAVVGNPAEVVLIRMMADGQAPHHLRRNYRGIVDALTRIVHGEGLLALWRGTSATASRAMILNGAQLGGYSQAKQYILGTGKVKDGLRVHVLASLFSGLLATTVSLPADILKTRLQNMHVDALGRAPYNGPVDCLVKTVKSEGVLSLWRGFMPFYLRLGPHTILTFVFLERIRNLSLYSSLSTIEGKV